MKTANKFSLPTDLPDKEVYYGSHDSFVMDRANKKAYIRPDAQLSWYYNSEKGYVFTICQHDGILTLTDEMPNLPMENQDLSRKTDAWHEAVLRERKYGERPRYKQLSTYDLILDFILHLVQYQTTSWLESDKDAAKIIRYLAAFIRKQSDPHMVVALYNELTTKRIEAKITAMKCLLHIRKVENHIALALVKLDIASFYSLFRQMSKKRFFAFMKLAEEKEEYIAAGIFKQMIDKKL